MRIGEIAEITGLSISNIRFYEKKGLIDPDREQQSKYRNYTENDVARLKQIILFRKMDLPIETICLLVKGQTSIEYAMEQQLLDLKEKQKMLQGSIDLCQKIVEDQSYDALDIDYYLDYVKEEESHGVKFALIDEVLTDFASFTQFNWFFGNPVPGCIYIRPWLYRLILGVWCVLWIAMPTIAIAEEFVEPQGVSARVIIFWIAWMLFMGITFFYFRKEKSKKQ